MIETKVIPFFWVVLLCLAGCEESDIEYFPLNEGKTWEYRIVTHDMDVEKKYKQLVINEGQQEVEGDQVFIRNINDEIQYLYKPGKEGIRRVGIRRKLDINTTLEEENFYTLKYPLEKGTSWEQETITGVLEVVIAPFRRHYAFHTPVPMKYTIGSVDEKLKVPAGRFNKCIKVVGFGTSKKVEAEKTIGTVDVTVESSDWYCPNVGLVKSQREERTTSKVLVKGDFLMELEKFSED
jgi:hypothetical protein